MLQNTFIHIPKVGSKTEQGLWKKGIRSWEDALRLPGGQCYLFGSEKQETIRDYATKSVQALKQGRAEFFSRLAEKGEAWRVFGEFASRTVYLDIETTGLSSVFDIVTMVGLYDGENYKVFVEGDNLRDLPAHLQNYSVVVTFNGTGFDLRFLKLAFPDLTLPPIHIDLRWTAHKLGIRGGLKSVEHELGLKRSDSVESLTGFDATVLWAKYLRGDKNSLERLIEYNAADTLHLKAIMEIFYDRLSKRLATFLKGASTATFSGLSQIRRSNKRSVLKRILPQPGVNPVKRLLEKCPDSGRSVRIVGIDLTGSEKRASGWALMERAKVSTKCVRTDAEIIAETIAAKPHLVSIDSPLSLPELHGKVPGPIYRKCELALKRMGISVFWCLLPSMEMLTRRGIGLAEQFRNAGLNVIESYPGAAQDILGIPRKKASLEELKWGLARAGIVGEFITERITHDEVDAITSALVGLFYLADEYMALGTPAEEYLIVPRSPNFNYPKLCEIISATGLDRIRDNPSIKVESSVNVNWSSSSAPN